MPLAGHNHEHTPPLGFCLGSAPLINSSDFVGRTAEIASIYDVLRPVQINTVQQKVVLDGFGGVGKTQLAHAVCTETKSSTSSIKLANLDEGEPISHELGNLPHYGLESTVSVLSSEEKRSFLQFVGRMLRWLPEERATAREFSSDKWLRS